MEPKVAVALISLLLLWLVVRRSGRPAARVQRADARAYEKWLARTEELLGDRKDGSAPRPEVVADENEMRFAVRAVRDEVLAWEGDNLVLVRHGRGAARMR